VSIFKERFSLYYWLLSKFSCTKKSEEPVFIERLWKSVKYEDVYLKSYGSMTEARRGFSDYFKFYNEKRWHQNFDSKTLGMVYFDSLAQKRAAA